MAPGRQSRGDSGALPGCPRGAPVDAGPADGKGGTPRRLRQVNVTAAQVADSGALHPSESKAGDMPPKPWKVTWVALADGAKALILLNEGTDAKPLLKVVSKSELENPPTHEQGADRPGRMPDTGAGQRSTLDETDWHEYEEARFVRELSARLSRAARAGRFNRLVLVAPPKVLGELRDALEPAATERVIAEVAKDLTGHPVDAIERLIARAPGA